MRYTNESDNYTNPLSANAFKLANELAGDLANSLIVTPYNPHPSTLALAGTSIVNWLFVAILVAEPHVSGLSAEPSRRLIVNATATRRHN